MSQLTEIENPNVPPIGARVVKVSLKYKKQTMEDLASSCVEDLAYRSVVGTNDPKEISVVIHPEPTSVKDGRGASIHCDRVIKTRFGPRKTDGLFFAYSPTLEISLESGHHIRATPGHKLYTGERWVECEALRVGDVLQLESGFSSIKSIQTHPDKTIVVDVCVPGPHEYIGNGIVSHNSILANQLAVNQSLIGYRTNMVPLEMSTGETLSRTMSSISGMNSIDIVLHRLASGERDLVWKRMRRFNRKIEAAGGQYTVFKPRSDMSMEEIMSAVHSLNCDVTYIDYISLLKGVGGDDSWQKLGEVARFGKIYAEMHNRVVVLLAQVSEEGRVRYSQAIKEHASLGWVFVSSKDSKEKGYLNIQTIKSRNQVAKDFTLKVEYSQTRVSDLDPSEIEKLEAERSQKSQSSAKRTKPSEQSDYKSAESSDDSLLPEL